MLKNKFGVSFCIGVYNEAHILLPSLDEIQKGLDRFMGKSSYEIIIVDNGSTDTTPSLLKKVSGGTVKTYRIDKKGHGSAYQFAINKAKYNHIILSAIDLPFGFSDLSNVMKIWDKFDIIYGSKAHPESKVFIPFQRKLSSLVYRKLLQTMFRIDVKDTQGSVFLSKKGVLPIIKFCDSSNAFLTAQYAIYGRLYSLRITEVPVIMSRNVKRKSKYNIFRDGKEMSITLFQEFFDLHFNKTTRPSRA